MEDQQDYGMDHPWPQVPDDLSLSRSGTEASLAFKCPIPACGKSFPESEDWIQHMRTHYAESLHLVSGRKIRYPRIVDLTRHVKPLPSLGEIGSSLITQQETSFYPDKGFPWAKIGRHRPTSLSIGSSSSLVSSNSASQVGGRSSPGSPLSNTSQRTNHSLLTSLSGLRISRERSDSVNSVGSCSSIASGNSDPKSVCEELPDFFETSRVQDHWKAGASILRRLKLAEESTHPAMSENTFMHLSKAIISLSSVTKEVNLNAKVWSAVGALLSCHARDLKHYSATYDPSTSIQEYIDVLKDFLALWAHTVDPSIHQDYNTLLPHQRTSRFSHDRHELSLLSQYHGIGPMDEDAIYEQKNWLEESFKVAFDPNSRRIGHPVDSTRRQESKGYQDAHVNLTHQRSGSPSLKLPPSSPLRHNETARGHSHRSISGASIQSHVKKAVKASNYSDSGWDSGVGEPDGNNSIYSSRPASLLGESSGSEGGPRSGESITEESSDTIAFVPHSAQLSGGCVSLNSLPNYPPGQKPPFSYPVLLRLAILGSPQKRLLLSQIYAAIEEKFPWYRDSAPKAWKASVRHCLSLNKEFVRMQRAVEDPGVGCGGWWSVGEGVKDLKRPRKRQPAQAKCTDSEVEDLVSQLPIIKEPLSSLRRQASVIVSSPLKESD